jgi:hypothetical protein
MKLSRNKTKSINQRLELFGDTLEETYCTQMCRDTQFEKHCLKVMKWEQPLERQNEILIGY